MTISTLSFPTFTSTTVFYADPNALEVRVCNLDKVLLNLDDESRNKYVLSLKDVPSKEVFEVECSETLIFEDIESAAAVLQFLKKEAKGEELEEEDFDLWSKFEEKIEKKEISVPHIPLLSTVEYSNLAYSGVGTIGLDSYLIHDYRISTSSIYYEIDDLCSGDFILELEAQYVKSLS